MDKRYFSKKIVEWYQQHKRPLPWRFTKDPYKIWLSEVILQQTRVVQGLPYYERFIEKYPTVLKLAKAPEKDVLRMWQGLGYYTRARNLHRCAKTVAELYNGVFPNNYAALKHLPGIGDYTAAAIASIAFAEPVAVVDGNVFRVLSRLFGIDVPVNSNEGRKLFNQLANELIPTKEPDIYNQAVMEFGATFCTPKSPSCEFCVFKKSCIAFNKSLQQQLPVKHKLKETRKRYFYYIVLQQGNKILMKRRGAKDIWLGLFDFPLIENDRSIDILSALKKTSWKNSLKKAHSVVLSKEYKHVLTHQTIISKFILIRFVANGLSVNGENGEFYTLKQIDSLPKPVLISRYLNDMMFPS